MVRSPFPSIQMCADLYLSITFDAQSIHQKHLIDSIYFNQLNRRRVSSNFPVGSSIVPLRLDFKQCSFHPYTYLYISPFSRDVLARQLTTFPTCYTPRPVSLSDKLGDMTPILSESLCLLRKTDVPYGRTMDCFGSPTMNRLPSSPSPLRETRRTIVSCTPFVSWYSSTSTSPNCAR